MNPRRASRRAVLRGASAAGALGLAGCLGGDGEEPTDGDGADPSGDDGNGPSGDDDGGGCTPGHTEGDPVCRQVADDAGVLTGFDAAGTGLAATFDYPCGWQTSTTGASPDWFQANVTRNGFGPDGEGYALVQVVDYYDPVAEGFLAEEKSSGDYDEVDYEYDGATRTGIVSTAATARFGTQAHAVVPFDGERVHVELVSTLKAERCGVDPRPDYDLVTAMLESLEPNPDSTFSTA